MRVPAAGAQELAFGLTPPLRHVELLEQRRVRFRQRGDSLLARRRVLGLGDFRRAGGEELLLLQLHAFPGRVAGVRRKAAGPAVGLVGGSGVGDAEDVGELQVPVEQSVLGGDRVDEGDHVVGGGAVGELFEGAVGDGGGVGGLGSEEGGAPGVGDAASADGVVVGL